MYLFEVMILLYIVPGLASLVLGWIRICGMSKNKIGSVWNKKSRLDLWGAAICENQDPDVRGDTQYHPNLLVVLIIFRIYVALYKNNILNVQNTVTRKVPV